MCKLNKKTGNRRIDPCMKFMIKSLNNYGVPTISSCCGHKKYPMTIIVMQEVGEKKKAFDLISGKLIPREKRFYKRDKQGYYYIPEVIKDGNT